MKAHIFVFALIVALATFLALFFLPYQILALGSCDLEMIFRVTDATTGESVPGASVHLLGELAEPDPVFARLTTDREGRARLLRPGNQCTDRVRPLRATVTRVSIPWDAVRVTAPSYRPLRWMHRADVASDDLGWDSSAARLYRVQFHLSLQPERDGEDRHGP